MQISFKSSMQRQGDLRVAQESCISLELFNCLVELFIVLPAMVFCVIRLLFDFLESDRLISTVQPSDYPNIAPSDCPTVQPSNHPTSHQMNHIYVYMYQYL